MKRFSHQFHENSPYSCFHGQQFSQVSVLLLATSTAPESGGHRLQDRPEVQTATGNNWIHNIKRNSVKMMLRARLAEGIATTHIQNLTCSQPQVLALKINMLNIYT